jgi:mannitol/fructose-specific phosphotransferase system IIA component (Ntr-type)
MRRMKLRLFARPRRVKESLPAPGRGNYIAPPAYAKTGASVLLSELLTTARVKVPLGGRTKVEVLRELVELVAAENADADVEAILASVREREDVLSTGIGGGIAIPHGKTPQVNRLTLVAGVASEGIEFDALDGKPVRLFFLLVGPESASGAHVKALSRISRMLRREDLRSQLANAASPDAFVGVIRSSEPE